MINPQGLDFHASREIPSLHVFFERVDPLIVPEEKKNSLILSGFVLAGGADKKCRRNGLDRSSSSIVFITY
jgi:hypothetical protein